MQERTIAVLLPGVMGSRLRDEKGDIWPGSIMEYFTGLSDENFQRLLGETVEPDGAITSYWPRQIYNEILEPLQTDYHFQLLDGPNVLPEEGRDGLMVFAYDWRQDNRIAASQLADCIDTLEETQKTSGRSFEIALLCHSMGGLVARYYLESRKLEHRRGLHKIAKIVFMGTPHQGAPEALLGITGQEAQLWMTARQSQALAAHPLYNAAYQLLPTEQLPFFLRNVVKDGMQPQPLHDGQVVEALELLQPSMDKAQAFHNELQPQMLMKSTLDVFSFYSSVHKTTSFVEFIDQEPDFSTGIAHDLHVHKLSSAGDGTVPVHSAFFPGALNIPVEKEHDKIFASNRVIRLLAYILLNREKRTAIGSIVMPMSLESIATKEDTDYSALHSFLTLDSIADLPMPSSPQLTNMHLVHTGTEGLESTISPPLSDAIVVALHSHLLHEPEKEGLAGVLVVHGLLSYHRLDWSCHLTLTRIMDMNGKEQAEQIGNHTITVTGATAQTVSFDWPGSDLLQLTPGEYSLTHSTSITTQNKNLPPNLQPNGEVRFIVRAT